MDKQQDSARTPMHRRVGAALAGIALALGLLTSAPAIAETVPAQPVPQATATATGTADEPAAAQSAGSDTGATSTVTNGSLSRKKTIAALVLGFVVASTAAVFVLRRSAQDNRLG